jgi:hypothetical protein
MPKLRYLMSEFKDYRVPITAGVDRGDPSWGQKVAMEDMPFEEPSSYDFLSYNVFDGHVFDINKEVC